MTEGVCESSMHGRNRQLVVRNIVLLLSGTNITMNVGRDNDAVSIGLELGLGRGDWISDLLRLHTVYITLDIFKKSI